MKIEQGKQFEGYSDIDTGNNIRDIILAIKNGLSLAAEETGNKSGLVSCPATIKVKYRNLEAELYISLSLNDHNEDSH